MARQRGGVASAFVRIHNILLLDGAFLCCVLFLFITLALLFFFVSVLPFFFFERRFMVEERPKIICGCKEKRGR